MDTNVNTVNEDIETLPKVQNIEKEVSDASTGGSIITGTVWWMEGCNKKTRDIPLTGDGMVTYSDRVLWDSNDTCGVKG